MFGKGSLVSTPYRRLRLMVAAHLVWLAMVCLLGAWWGKLVLDQASRIADLEKKLGLAADLTQDHWQRTQRMLFWESATFFILISASAVLLFWLFWRDMKRARGLQAFFASFTHELRTPLTSIRLQAESIAEGLSRESSQKNLIQRLLEDTIRLEGQVERTLELARVEGGGPVFTQPLQIKPWLDRFLKVWGADYLGRVEFETQVGDLLIEADPTAIQMIFKNLFENSVRHSKREHVKITLSAFSGEQGVSILVRDNGQGFSGDEKCLGRIFQKGASSPGTGVGLYLVTVLMKRMGGSASFRSQNGFEVQLGFQEGKLLG